MTSFGLSYKRFQLFPMPSIHVPVYHRGESTLPPGAILPTETNKLLVLIQALEQAPKRCFEEENNQQCPLVQTKARG